jgi:uncharacterized protein with PIN domain
MNSRASHAVFADASVLIAIITREPNALHLADRPRSA